MRAGKPLSPLSSRARRGSKPGRRQQRISQDLRPVAAFRQRGNATDTQHEEFNAPEVWHEPTGRGKYRFVIRPASEGYVHAVTPGEVRERLAQLPERFTRGLEIVQFSPMTRKRHTFPCYGMQWGASVYLYPIEATLVEEYIRPPLPQQLIESKMFGGKWSQDGKLWRLTWTEQAIKDFYLNNVLIHEVGHLNDARNNNFQDRERFANWFAIEYGYRATR